MLIAPRPSAETAGPSLPRMRVCIVFSLVVGPSPTLRRCGGHRERSVHHGRAAPWIGGCAARDHEVMQREELADFLRRRREAIRPADVGITDGPRRRTAGLRRE